ncbi:MAG: bifunctional diguanylate cyclase/phosphodiesterase [Gammaproteobacteria bacterium]|nr:bifunctional diguanylate cyclase/phosphodiesterase [Gammaproteobacteria bacterium]
MPKSLASALRITILYAVFAALWIVFSDKALELLIHDVNFMTQAQTLKGWLFVVVTAALLFVLVSNAFRTIEALNQMDSLTGLARHFTFQQILDQRLHLRAEDQQVVLMYLDIVGFSKLNHSLGFDGADKILTSFAQRLKTHYSASVLMGRLGPDQFAIAQVVTKGEEHVDSAINQFRQLFDTNARANHLEIDCAMGVAIEPNDGRTAKLLMSSANSALTKAKLENSGIQFFNQELSKQETERQLLLQDLRLALKNEHLSLVYQPQYDLRSNNLTGVEVLIRWRHPRLGFIPPDQFIELAEENNLCDKISAFVLKRAQQELGGFGLLDGVIPRVSINISAVEFNSTLLMEKLMVQINKAEELAPLLQIEITETAALDDITKSVSVIKRLKQKGIRFSVDDFGTGYTSLVILRDLPIDEVKIDRSFIHYITRDKKSHAIVQAIITMTQGFDMTVVAEGVETDEQRAMLAQLGCNEAQGYLLAMPMEVHQLAEHFSLVG